MEDATIRRVRAIVEPLVAEADLELYDVDRRGGSLVVSVDAPAREGRRPGVDLDDLARLSRAISRELDEVDPIPSRYTLEVSSPGLERALRTPAHFAAAVGQLVTVKLRPGTDPRRVRGTLVSAGAETAEIRPEDDSSAAVTIHFDDLEKARTVFEWGAADTRATTSKKVTTR